MSIYRIISELSLPDTDTCVRFRPAFEILKCPCEKSDGNCETDSAGVSVFRGTRKAEVNNGQPKPLFNDLCLASTIISHREM